MARTWDGLKASSIESVTPNDEEAQENAHSAGYLKSESGCPRCKGRGCFVCIFPAWWTHYLYSVFAASQAQTPLSLLFLELSGYSVNIV
jgi:hypothetical protein